jgi:hypothetical protein
MNTIRDYLESYFTQLGLSEDNLTGKIKRRNIRIQLCMKGIDIDRLETASINDKEALDKVSNALKTLKA